MSQPPLDDNPWRAKARALDRYRWQLLRERHGLFGSLLRFVREAWFDLLFGWRARRRLDDGVQTLACELLLLQSAPKVIAFQRKRLLIDTLRARGHLLLETALDEPARLLAGRCLAAPPYPVPLRYFGYAAHAQWLERRYQPRLLLNDRNGSFYVPFLRLALNARGALLVHLAHASTVEGSRRLGMNDYDYYLLFGRSSLEALLARRLRFGSSRAVLCGSHMIDGSYELPPPQMGERTLLLLGVGPDKEKLPGYRRTYRLLREWAQRHPEQRLLVKAHPRSSATFWREAAASLGNVELLPPGCGLADALARASAVFSVISNAVIEATLAGRPVIYVNVSQETDIFQQERFFGPAVRDLPTLESRLRALEHDYPMEVEKARQFCEYHLAHRVAGLANTLEVLEALLQGRPQSIASHPLPAAPSGSV
ncbi:capsule biosynthesis protein [Pseudomonas sp. RIT-PI-AD]|uniref:capsule biosynthesis protein n=1 Tax=Pseudomonas sp. RIT-PI-AD TaxID=3035294 RepID=UPI0021DA979C|nr:capsule biosynthesis protein [Pseudomonas sp. RIT-PI-AD]